MNQQQYPRGVVLSATSIMSDGVYNTRDEKLGGIKDIMIDTGTGRIQYAVLSYGGLFGLGDKLFAVPWEALRIDTVNHRIIFDVSEETLKNSPGFDKDNWPDFADETWANSIHDYYNVKPWWRDRDVA